MDLKMFERNDRARPDFNKDICLGLAYRDMQNAPKIIHELFQSISSAFPPGFRYLGTRQLSPTEQFRVQSRRPSTAKLQYEMLRSDIYTIGLEFDYKGVKQKPRYLSLIYAGEGGRTHLWGTKYTIMPTLTDNMFSIIDNSILVILNQTRFKVEIEPYGYAHSSDEHSGIYNTNVHWSRIYKSGHTKVSMRPCLANYLFVAEGVTGAFKKYFDTDVKIVGIEDLSHENFPEDKYVLCGSSGIPKGKKATYLRPVVGLVIPKEQYNQSTRSLVCALFYILDSVSYAVSLQPHEMDIPLSWKNILTHFIWANPDGAEELVRIDNHLVSSERYVDMVARRKFEAANLDIPDIMSLYTYMIKNFTRIYRGTNPADLSNKCLLVAPVVLFDIIGMIVHLQYSLDKLNPEKINAAAIEKVFDMNFQTSKIMGIKSRHPEVAIVDSASDQYLYKLTTQCAAAHSAPTKTIASEQGKPAFALDPSQMVVNTVRAVSKRTPSSVGTLNQYLEVDKHGAIQVPDELVPYLNACKALM